MSFPFSKVSAKALMLSLARGAGIDAAEKQFNDVTTAVYQDPGIDLNRDYLGSDESIINPFFRRC